MKLTSTPIAWNTGAFYTARGQRIAAARIDGVPHFADIDRGLVYSFACNGEITKDHVMYVYHNNLGSGASWQERSLLAPFAENETPMTQEYYELARRIRQGAALTRVEEEQLPAQRGDWSDKFLARWENRSLPRWSFMVECNYAGYGDNWGDAEWTVTDTDDKTEPMRFTTVEEAQAEIDQFIKDADAGIGEGEYDAEDYRIVLAYPSKEVA